MTNWTVQTSVEMSFAHIIEVEDFERACELMTISRAQGMLGEDKIGALSGELDDRMAAIEWIRVSETLTKISDRLRARLSGPQSAQYASITAKLEQFESTSYVSTADGVRQAILDLVTIAKKLREVDDLVGEAWERVDAGTINWKQASKLTINYPSALSRILLEYCPTPMLVGLDDVTAALDRIVDRLSGRRLREDVSAQKAISFAVLMECRRQGVLPRSKKEATKFIDQLLEYINTHLA